jgi:hypothetical protein
VTDVDELPTSLGNSPAFEPHAPVLTRRRRHHRVAWWVLATVVLGALLGGGLAVLADRLQHDGAGASATPSTTAVPGAAALASGQRDHEGARPALHSIDNRVFVVGDSVMQGAAPYLGDLLEGWSVIADTRVGRFIGEANKVIVKRRKDIGDIAVLNLGNNYDGDREEFARQVDFALAALTDVEHVIWVNVGEFESDRAEVNEVVQQAAKSHPNVTIVDWNSWWEKDGSLTGGDHLHLTPEGAEAYAKLIASAVLRETEAAGEIPAPGAKPPKLNTSGKIPGSTSSSSGSKGSSTRRRSPSTRSSPDRHTATTVAPRAVDPVSPTSPPETSPPATTPPATDPPAAPATSTP